jgi:hypothetical protein
MVHFFGIFTPGAQQRISAEEAPHKASFFGGRSAVATEDVVPSRLEQVALYMAGKAPEPHDHAPIGAAFETKV